LEINLEYKRYYFDVTISGIGRDPEEAWDCAVEAFTEDPGICPEDYEVIEEEEFDEN
jgi:hypothetical protein